MLIIFSCRIMDDIIISNAASKFSTLSSVVSTHVCEPLSRTWSLNRRKRVLYLNELCLRPFIIVLQPLLLLVIRHQNDAPFDDLYRDLLSGIKTHCAQPLAGKDDFRRGFVENVRAVSQN
ncbi:Uncharacterised protein [Enterobacter cloacae]|nr:Uncharacterised protein [Enterobacter cloacae]